MKNIKQLQIIIFLSLFIINPLSTFAGGGHEHGHSEKEPGHDKNDEHAGHNEEEGTIQLTEDAVRNTKIDVREAGPATLSMLLKVNGRISPISSNVAHIASRFSGVISEVKKDIGDSVKSGDVLAIVESNQNLQKFEVRALQGGTITDRHATIGESIKEDEALFIVMNLSQLWADFTIFQRDVSKVKLGQAIQVYVSGRSEPFKATISFISPVVDETTQSRTARAVITDPDNSLAPGAFVSGQIVVADFQVPIAVTYDSIQSIEGINVIFVQEEKHFEKREIFQGRSDGTFTEILSGVNAGEKYAASNSFILKAELGKSEAEHEH
jgi:membrane fusion protein, heavy metal efflux system